MSHDEKRPRQWAAEIAALPTLQQRRERLMHVPKPLQGLVKKHLELSWLRKPKHATE